MFLKSLFIEAAISELVQAGFGINQSCLYHLNALVEKIINDYGGTHFQVMDNIADAYKGLKKFTKRMIDSADNRNLKEIDELDFMSARDKCGILFICLPPDNSSPIIPTPPRDISGPTLQA